MAYPTSIDTDSDLYLTKNQLSTVLNGSIDAVVTTITATSTTGFPGVGVITIDSEVVKYTSVNATQFLGCTRGFDGTGATTHTSGAIIKHAVTAIHHNALKDSLIQVETDIINSVKLNLKNIIVNGGFEVWQRNTTFSNPANASYNIDHWQVGTSEAATVTLSREASTIDSGLYSAKAVLTGSTAAQTWRMINTVENFADYRGKTLSFSCRVFSSVASAIKVQMFDGVTSTESSFHTGGGGWETLTVTKTLSASASSLYVGVGMLNSGDKKNGTYYFDSAMLTIGATPITFVPTDPQTELAQCQRYYEKSYDVATAPGTVTTTDESYTPSVQGIGGNYVGNVTFKVTKRAAPTITFYNPSTGSSGSWRAYSTAGTDGNITPSAATTAKHSFAPSNGTNSSPLLHGHWTAEAEI